MKKSMKMTYDEDADGAYIYVKEKIEKGGGKKDDFFKRKYNTRF